MSDIGRQKKRKQVEQEEEEEDKKPVRLKEEKKGGYRCRCCFSCRDLLDVRFLTCVVQFVLLYFVFALRYYMTDGHIFID